MQGTIKTKEDTPKKQAHVEEKLLRSLLVMITGNLLNILVWDALVMLFLDHFEGTSEQLCLPNLDAAAVFKDNILRLRRIPDTEGGWEKVSQGICGKRRAKNIPLNHKVSSGTTSISAKTGFI